MRCVTVTRTDFSAGARRFAARASGFARGAAAVAVENLMQRPTAPRRAATTSFLLDPKYIMAADGAAAEQQEPADEPPQDDDAVKGDSVAEVRQSLLESDERNRSLSRQCEALSEEKLRLVEVS